MVNKDQLLGKGISFPIALEDGAAKILGGKELIRLSIPNILSWYLGRRYMQGQYGSRWEDLLEKPVTPSLAALVRVLIVQAISSYETRINLLQVNILHRNDKLFIHLKYKIKLDNTEDSFILPFYQIIKN